MTDLKLIESLVLTLSPSASIDQVAQMMEAVSFAKGMLKSIDTLLEEKLIEHIEANGPIEVGDMLYIVGYDKSYKPRKSPQEMTEGFMNLSQGDMQAFCGYLAANCYKPGAIRRDLQQKAKPELFDEFFETVIRKTIDGKPIKKVKKLDTRFVETRPHGAALEQGEAV